VRSPSPPKAAEAGNEDNDSHPHDAWDDILHCILHRREEETVHAVGMTLDDAAKLIKEKVRWCTEETDFNDIVAAMMADVEFCVEEHYLWDIIFNVNENARKCLVCAIVSLIKPAKFSKNDIVQDKVESRSAWDIKDFWGVVEEQGDYYKGMVEAESSTRSADGGVVGAKKPVSNKKKYGGSSGGQGSGSSGKPAGMTGDNGSHGQHPEGKSKVSCYHCNSPHPVRLCDKAPQAVKDDFKWCLERGAGKAKMVMEGDKPNSVILIKDRKRTSM
jgi:hypothetical protein